MLSWQLFTLDWMGLSSAAAAEACEGVRRLSGLMLAEGGGRGTGALKDAAISGLPDWQFAEQNVHAPPQAGKLHLHVSTRSHVLVYSLLRAPFAPFLRCGVQAVLVKVA